MEETTTEPKTKRHFVSIIMVGALLVMLPAVLLLAKTPKTTNNRASAQGYLLADVNHDGQVNFDDVSLIRQAIETHSYRKEADLNRDHVVNELDIRMFYDAISLRL